MVKIKLGKTKESRTRRKEKPKANPDQAIELKILLQHTNSDFIDYLLAKGYSSKSTERYARDIEKFIQWARQENIPVESAGYADILYYVQSKKGKNCQRTLSIYVNSIKHYYEYLRAIGAIEENPVLRINIKGIKRKKLYDILSMQELESLYGSYEIPDEESRSRNQNWFKKSIMANKRNKVILGLMVYQGLGSLDLGNLRANDLKLREGKIYIAGTRRSNERELKLESHQVIDIMEYTLKVREELLQFTGKKSDRLFVSNGTSEKFNNIMQLLIKKLHEQNSKVSSTKQIRASVITHWLKLYNLREVQYMAGHRYVSSTEAYLINDLDDLSEEIEKYHPIG